MGSRVLTPRVDAVGSASQFLLPARPSSHPLLAPEHGHPDPSPGWALMKCCGPGEIRLGYCMKATGQYLSKSSQSEIPEAAGQTTLLSPLLTADLRLTPTSPELSPLWEWESMSLGRACQTFRLGAS